jgi:hypothetical protein
MNEARETVVALWRESALVLYELEERRLKA